MGLLKDIRAIAIILMIALGLGFEGLSKLQLKTPTTKDEIGKAGELFSIYRESTLPIEKKSIRRPKAQVVRKAVARGEAIKFDLKAAITSYQKEHGLEEHDFGAKQRPDKLKKELKKKKKAIKYEYVYDLKNKRWVKRRKLSDEQKENLLAHKEREEYLRKLAEYKKKQAEKNKKTNDTEADSNSSDYTASRMTAQNTDQQDAKKENKTERDWTQDLLHHPDQKALQEFMNAYRNGEVSTSIFSSITKQMIEDPRLEMKDQAIKLISSFPSLASFKLAVHFLRTDLDPASAQRAQVNQIISNDYTVVSRLHILDKILKTNEIAAETIRAVIALEEASRRHLSTSLTNASHFTPFLSILKELAQGEESLLVSQVNQTLNQLNSILRQDVASLAPEAI